MASEFGKLWDLIFENLGLTRFLLAVPPATMATLLTTQSPSSGTRSGFSHAMSIQYLGFECEDGETIRIDK